MRNRGREHDRVPARGPSGIPRSRRPGWSRPDPIDELARELEVFVAAAVHPDEVAALLESDGLSDDQIRERYGVGDSFALAEQLYDRTPRRHPEPDGPPPDPWRIGLLGCLLRGLVFALPGFGYVLGAPLLVGPHHGPGLPAGTRALLAGALCGWAWNQGLAHRAYSWLGLGDRLAARRCLLTGTPVGMLLGTLAALAVAGPGHPVTAAFAAGQSCYLGAAGVLLVLGRERVLLAALLPMTGGALLALARPVPEPARLALLLGSLAAVAVLGLCEVASAAPPLRVWTVGLTTLLPFPLTRPRVRRRPALGPRLRSSLPYAVFGLGTGVLVLCAGLGDVLGGAGTNALAAPAAVALTLSMGPAEWVLYRFRSGGLAALRASGTPRAFRRATVRTLAGCLTGYLVVLLVLTLAVTAPWPGAFTPTGLRLAGLLALGVVLWTGLLLQSFGAVIGAAAVCGAAALAQSLALLTRAGQPHTVALTVYTAAALAQSVLVCGLLGRGTAHR
ncbi:hypothetical protein LK07_08865 [Streptomyces pluripotens]|uniref:Uncharacterized protein n=1 Tax=Streptomyces pluripotens TaxID=1355015 RepID=A0A221P870_9ACTN|nr:hypothetical protein LK07_08865 [Streptomyces pluripotens]KIE24201.1 membrane protein [Streptomyces sp. MUSC 125]MCH0555617.1 hypothetical protein [Streptomyces sp. MUM 16J]